MCKEDTQKLVDISKSFKADAFLSIARGGLTLSHLMSQALNQRNVFTINSISYDRKNQKDSIEIFNIPDLKSYKKVLIIDDIVDSGKTMIEVFKILNEKFPKKLNPHIRLLYIKIWFYQSCFFIKKCS
jgi:xanthine phosphoribosyltransferase